MSGYDFRVWPGNANLPIGVLCFGAVANREIGVPRFHPPTRSPKFKFGYCFKFYSLEPTQVQGDTLTAIRLIQSTARE